MKHTQLKAEARAKAGKGAARAIRRENKVPGVIYGDNKEPVLVALVEKELMKAANSSAFYTSMCDLDVDGVKHSVFPRDIQLDFVTDRMIHVDFLRVSDKTEITVSIPVHVINSEKSKGIVRGGVISMLRHEIEVNCQAMNVPAAIEVDVSELDVGHSIHVKDLKMPKGAKALEADDISVVTIVAPSAMKSDEAATATTEAAAAAPATTEAKAKA